MPRPDLQDGGAGGGDGALIGKLFDGSPDLLFASLLDSRKLSAEQLERLKKLVFAMEQEHRS